MTITITMTIDDEIENIVSLTYIYVYNIIYNKTKVLTFRKKNCTHQTNIDNEFVKIQINIEIYIYIMYTCYNLNLI